MYLGLIFSFFLLHPLDLHDVRKRPLVMMRTLSLTVPREGEVGDAGGQGVGEVEVGVEVLLARPRKVGLQQNPGQHEPGLLAAVSPGTMAKEWPHCSSNVRGVWK